MQKTPFLLGRLLHVCAEAVSALHVQVCNQVCCGVYLCMHQGTCVCMYVCMYVQRTIASLQKDAVCTVCVCVCVCVFVHIVCLILFAIKMFFALRRIKCAL